MTIDSPVWKAVLVMFAVIGALAVLALLGMVFMHAGMMASPATMLAACKSMMGMAP